MTSQSSRLNRASNDIFDATSFLQGANAAFIESLYAQ
jgi:2-oxoglutarate dehydrogenase N-terminus